jgi:hypothetical protein
VNEQLESIKKIYGDAVNDWLNYRFEEAIDSINKKDSMMNNFYSSTKDVGNNYLNKASTYISINDSFKKLISLNKNLSIALAVYKAKNDSGRIQSLQALKENFEKTQKSFASGNYSSIEDINNKTKSLLEEANNLLSKYSLEEDDLLSSLKDLLIKTNKTIHYKLHGDFPSTNPEFSKKTICSGLKDLQRELEIENNNSINRKQELYPFLNNSELLVLASELYIKHLFTLQINSSHEFILNESFEHATTDYPIEDNGSETNEFNISSINETSFREISPIHLSTAGVMNKKDLRAVSIICNEGDILSTNDYFKTNSSSSLISELNNKLSELNNSLSIIKKLLDDNSLNNEQYAESTNTLPKLEPLCCFSGNCSPCCQQESCADENYPVLLIHGHSFDKSNSPELALSRLSPLQRSLENDGFINAGQISRNSNIGAIPFGDWGRVGKPVSVLVTYYYLTHNSIGGVEFITQKTDGIENYAIRPKEMIDLVKQRTGKNKVILVAHSMGGLVCREYLYLFGEDSVDKLIELGSPNKGIEGDVKSLCPVTGGKKECYDMDRDSPFLSKLNNPSYRPTIPIYTITASGCSMSTDSGSVADGDGVVIVNNSLLPYATNYFVNGTCTDIFNSNLHLRFVDPEEFPRTYDLIKKILIKK